MSMIFNAQMASDEEIRSLLSNPATVEDFVYDEEREALGLEKGWHGLHWLLTGSAWEGKEPWCYLVLGGQEIDDVDVGYGPARAFTSEKVREWSEALSTLSREELEKRFDPNAMMRNEIYPTIWDRALTGEENVSEWLLEYYDHLRAFLKKAVEKGSGVVLSIT